MLYGGYSTVYERQEKKLKEETSLTEGLKRFIVTETSYYIRKDQKVHSVGSKKGMLDLLRIRKVIYSNT